MSKVPFFADFYNLEFTNVKFWHFLDCPKFLIYTFAYLTLDLWQKVGNQ